MNNYNNNFNYSNKSYQNNRKNYNNTTIPPSWDDLPSATPTPDPLNSEDFYVLFPRKTILPDETQY